MPFIILTYEEVILGDTADMGDLPQGYGAPIHTGITDSMKGSLSERIPSMVYGITPTQSPHKHEEDIKPKSLSEVIVGPHSQATSPKEITREILSREVLKFPPTKINKNGEREGDLGMVEPEFYEKEIKDYNEQSLAGNTVCMIDMPNLQTKYGPNNFILNRKLDICIPEGGTILSKWRKRHISFQ